MTSQAELHPQPVIADHLPCAGVVIDHVRALVLSCYTIVLFQRTRFTSP
jgi:hypothetical protein